MSEAPESAVDLLEPIGESIAHAVTVVNPADLLSLPDELSQDVFDSSLLALGDAEAVELCSKLVMGREMDEGMVRHVLRCGIERGDAGNVEEMCDAREGGEGGTNGDNSGVDALQSVADGEEAVVDSYQRLKELEYRLETWTALAPSTQGGSSSGARPSQIGGGEAKEGETDIEIDDPWAEGQTDEPPELDDPWEAGSSRSVQSTKSRQSRPDVAEGNVSEDDEPPISLHDILSLPLADSALAIASSAAVPALKIVYARHAAELWPYREALLDAMPAWVSPADLKDVGILPGIGEDGKEAMAPSTSAHGPPALPVSSLPTTPQRTASEVRSFYIDRIDSLDALGLLDIQLAWVQHGASLAVPDLDSLGEELSLLSRLVYDAHLSPAQQITWTLSSWRTASPEEICSAYLSNTTPTSIVSDIRRLILPYLYVLESRAERSGQPSSDLIEKRLHSILLGLPLHLALPIFEASKATLPAPERILKNDMTVARLALACLYGSNTRDAYSTMSAIFECLPVWDISGGDLESDREATATTLDSIATFVRPTRAGAHPPTAKDLFVFFSPLPFASLSRALDILDVHLESGELLARWDTPVQLRFLLQSARDKSEQVELAEKMVRRQVSANLSEARWTALWGDMKRLSGGDDALLRGAFGVLSHEVMMKIYLGGVLASGKFDIARRMVKKLQTDEAGSVPDDMLESVVLQTSREFYENAESGNIHTGDMKLAYDCLSVAPQTDLITHERDFIEATSRIATYNLKSPSSSSTSRTPLSPLEIRHSKNRLSFVSQILATSDDAYRHPELILTLVNKLGYRSDTLAQIRVRAMLTSSAVRNADYEVGYTHSQDMFEMLQKRNKKTRGVGSETDEESASVVDDVWHALLSLGECPDYPDISNRLTVLGQALAICPAGDIPRILVVWRKVEGGQIKLTEAAKRRRLAGIRQPQVPSHLADAGSPSSPSRGRVVSGGGEERVLGSRTAARAARLAMGFAGDRLNLRGIAGSPLLGSISHPTSRTSSPNPDTGTWGSSNIGSNSNSIIDETSSRRSGESDRSAPAFGAMFDGAGVKAGTAEAERVRQQARKALVRGVGWLLGADEREIAEGGQ